MLQMEMVHLIVLCTVGHVPICLYKDTQREVEIIDNRNIQFLQQCETKGRRRWCGGEGDSIKIPVE